MTADPIAELYAVADDNEADTIERLRAKAGQVWIHYGCWTNTVGEPANFAILEADGSVADRFATVEEARKALPGFGSPGGQRIDNVPDPTWQRCEQCSQHYWDINEDDRSKVPAWEAAGTPLLRFTAKVIDAIDDVDNADLSMLYVQSFVVAESGVPLRVMQWHEDRWQETTRAELIELWRTWGLEGP